MRDATGEARVDEASAPDGAPWAIALNETAATEGLTITLLSLAIVGDVIRVSGIVRLVGRPDAQLVSIPSLTLAAIGGPPLGLIRAHVLPDGRHVWASWTYERPTCAAADFGGHIDQVELAYRGGGVARETMTGPWAFRFHVPAPPSPSSAQG